MPSCRWAIVHAGRTRSAPDYYNQAISSGATSGDYALYQKGVILGVQGRFNDKILTPEKLVEVSQVRVLRRRCLRIAQANLTIRKKKKRSRTSGRSSPIIRAAAT